MSTYETIYKDKEIGYFTAARMDIIDLLPKNENNRILELGAGTGETLIVAKKLGLAKEVVGIELFEIENSSQKSSCIDRFVIGNIETIDLKFEECYFDVIICADVLEHLVDPWQVIEKLSKYLKKGGFFISSIPNIRNYRAMGSIFLDGDFKYEGGGILDRTHLRFFCKKNVVEMFENKGYDIVKFKKNMGGYGIKHKLVNFLTFRLLEDFFVFQFFTVARKK